MKKNRKNYNIETITSHSGKNPSENHGIPAPPLYRTSTILSPRMDNYRNRIGKYTYGRNGTPTSDSLISALSDLYKGGAGIPWFSDGFFPECEVVVSVL